MISVIVPVYNKEKFINISINSILKQSYTDFEIIAIDDGSTDDTFKVLEELRNKDARLKIFKQDNKGVAYTRNKGIQLSGGEYISFLDADDFWDAEFLKEMIYKIQNRNICYCHHKIIKNGKCKPIKIKFSTGDILIPYLSNKTTPNTNSWLIKKSFIMKNNIFFPESLDWGEDMVFFIKCLVKEKEVVSCNKFLSNYVIHPEESLSVPNINKIQKDILWIKLISEYILKNENNYDNIIKSIVLLFQFRLASLTIMNLIKNIDCLNYSSFKEVGETYPYIKNIKFVNGVRSLKILLRKFQLMRLLYIKRQ